MAISTTIDAKIEAVARRISNANGRDADYIFKSAGGALIPGWALYASEADKIIQHEAMLVDVRKMK